MCEVRKGQLLRPEVSKVVSDDVILHTGLHAHLLGVQKGPLAAAASITSSTSIFVIW